MRSCIIGLLITAMVGATSACESTIDVHGNAPAPERLDLVKVGKFNKNDVLTVLGSPSNRAPFGDDHWYYISSKFESWAFLAPEEIERQIVVIDFDFVGRVKEIRKLTLKDGKEIAMVSRETPTAGQDFTILEQLLGNIGKFNRPTKSAPGSGGDTP